MFRKKKKNKLLAYVGVLSMIFLQIPPEHAWAADASSNLAGKTQTSAVNNAQSAAANKAGGPTVKITFSGTSLKTGTKVNAMAITNGFKAGTGAVDGLYFTWYIKHVECDLTKDWWKDGATEDGADRDKKLKTCDLDGDGLVTPNDWKIAAARIIVKGSFDKTDSTCDATNTSCKEGYKCDTSLNSCVVDYSSTTGFVGDDASGMKAVPSVTDSVGDKDKGWIKNFKRDDSGKLAKKNDKDAPNCYVQQPTSGYNYELRDTGFAFDDCPQGYHPACLQDTTAPCNVLNPAYNQAAEDAYNNSKAAHDAAVAWNADPLNATDPLYPKTVPAIVPMPAKTIINNFAACAVKVDSTDPKDVFSCIIKDETDLTAFMPTLGCLGDNEIPLCAKGAAPASAEDTDVLKVATAPAPLIGRIFKRDKVKADPAQNDNGSLPDSTSVCGTLAEPNLNPVVPQLPETVPPAPPVVQPLNQGPPPFFLDNTNFPPIPDPATGIPVSPSKEKCSVLSDALINGISEDTTISGIGVPNGNTIVKGDKTLSPTCTFIKGDNLCKHLFPYFPKENVTLASGSTVNLKNDATGDGKFTIEEKEFWGADPTVASTDATGKKDEANVMGLGIDKFSWTYAKGDEIGVAVEGESDMGTKHRDNSFMTMWAFSKGACPALKEIENNTSISSGARAFYTEDNGNVKIFTTDFDLDRCLDDNLVEVDGDGLYNIKVDLSATPSNPVNDPNGMGDQVSVKATVQNVDEQNSLSYVWKIEKSENGSTAPNDETIWKDITSDMMKSKEQGGYESFSATEQQGIGKNAIDFLLNLPAAIVDPTNDGEFYLRVKATVSENSGLGGQTGKGSVIIKVAQQQNQIDVYPAVPADDGTLSLGTVPLCGDTAGRSKCLVANNQLVGLTITPKDNVSGFVWKVNGVGISCVGSAACGTDKGATIFLPILGNEGEAVDVVVTSNKAAIKSTIEIIRHFVIVEPQATITSTDQSSVWPKFLGYYRHLGVTSADDINYPDYSPVVFQTNSGKTMSFSASVVSAVDYAKKYTWIVDGQEQDASMGSQLSIPVDKQVGDSYTIGLLAETENKDSAAEQTKLLNNLHRALLKNWNISPENILDEPVGANIQVDVVESPTQMIVDSEKTGIFASLVTNLPEQLMFLLKSTLTGFMLIFSMGLLFALIPDSLFEKKRTE